MTGAGVPDCEAEAVVPCEPFPAETVEGPDAIPPVDPILAVVVVVSTTVFEVADSEVIEIPEIGVRGVT